MALSLLGGYLLLLTLGIVNVDEKPLEILARYILTGHNRQMADICGIPFRPQLCEGNVRNIEYDALE